MNKADKANSLTVAEFFDRRPCNLHHSSLPVSTKEYFREVRERKFFVEPHLLPFMEVDRWKGKTVLDVGCGLGSTVVEFARAGALVTGMDVSKKSVSLTLDHLIEENLIGGIELADADRIRDISYYDLIFAWGSVHHTENPESVLARLHWLRANRFETVLKLMVYHTHSTKALRLWWEHGREWRHYTEAQEGCPITHTYTLREAKDLVESYGWRVVKAEIAHIFPWRVEDYVQYRYVKGFPWNITPGPVFRWMERHFGWHILIEAVAK